MTLNANRHATSAASSRLLSCTLPNAPEALTSTTSSTVSSRSSVNFFTNASPYRAVTFQSIVRTSSPGWYSRTSSKFIPRPLKTLRYWPAKAACTMPRVLSSSLRIFLRISRGDSVTNDERRMKGLGSASFQSGNRQASEDSLDDLFARDLFRFRFVADDDAMTKHVGADTLHIVRSDIAAPGDERASSRSKGQGNRCARRCSVADHPLELQPVGCWIARGEYDVDNVVLHAVIHVDLIHQRPGPDNIGRLHDCVHGQIRCARAHQVENLPFLGLRRIA